MASGLSSSGARIRGDDYQHLAGWIQVVEALLRGSHVERIGIEDPGHPGADDVTVYRDPGPHLFLQAKSAVDARRAASFEWFCQPSAAAGLSILQKFHRVWASHASGARPKLVLLTNRPLDRGDPLLPLMDGRDGTIGVRLAGMGARTPAGEARRQVAAHLQISEDELLDFLRDFRPIVGRLHNELIEEARLRMTVAGLRRDDEAVRRGVDMVHDWVTSGERRIRTLDELRTEVQALGLADHQASGLLLIQALDRNISPTSSSVAIDWVDHFAGDEPRVRRELTDPALWNTKFRSDLRTAAQQLRAQGHRSVLVEGHARLPTWFAAGIELCQTAGFDVVSIQRGTPWPSSGPVTPFGLRLAHDEHLGNGADLAVGVAISRDLALDVLPYVRDRLPSVGRYLSIEPAAGPGGQAIPGESEARGCALAVRDQVRDLARLARPQTLHLFLCCPRGIALLLGHAWDRMPLTQLHEDLSTRGYLPSYLVPN